MSMRSVRRVTAARLVAFTLPLVLLTGCGGEDPEAADTGGESPASSAVPQDTTTPATTPEESALTADEESVSGQESVSGGSESDAETDAGEEGDPSGDASGTSSDEQTSGVVDGDEQQDDIEPRGGGAVQIPESGDTTPFAFVFVPEDSGEEPSEPAIASEPVWRTDWYVAHASGNALWLTDSEDEPEAVAVVSGDGKVLWEASLVEGAMKAEGEVTDFAITVGKEAFIVTRIVDRADDADSLKKGGRVAEAWKVGRDGAERIPFPEGETLKLADEEDDDTYLEAEPGGFTGQDDNNFQAVTNAKGKTTMQAIDSDLHIGRSFTAGWLRAAGDGGETLTVESDAHEGRDVSAPDDYLSPDSVKWDLDDMVALSIGAGRVLDLENGEVYNSNDKCEANIGASHSASPDRRFLVAGSMVIDRELEKSVCSPDTDDYRGVQYEFVTDEGVAYGWTEGEDGEANWVVTKFGKEPKPLRAVGEADANTFSAVGEGLVVQRSKNFEGAVIWKLDELPSGDSGK